MIDDTQDRRRLLLAQELGHEVYGPPDQDIFDVVCNDLLRLELHVKQAVARLSMMAGTKAEPALSHPQRVFVRNTSGTIKDLTAMTEVYASRVAQARPGLAAIFGHLGERERIS